VIKQRLRDREVAVADRDMDRRHAIALAVIDVGLGSVTVIPACAQARISSLLK